MQANMTFSKDQFLSKNHPSSDFARYLIIGFDTEYQREEFVNADGLVEIRNKVLSYQYSCRVMTLGNDRSCLGTGETGVVSSVGGRCVLDAAGGI